MLRGGIILNKKPIEKPKKLSTFISFFLHCFVL